MKGVILAAGKGSRLYPVTHHIPKPLLPLANRITLAYAFDKLKEIGIREIALVVGENEPLMRERLGDGSEFGIELTYVRQPEPKGLAHAVSFAGDFVNREPFVLYLGDAIYADPLPPFEEKFRSSGCANLNVVKWVEDPSRFGVANLDGDRILRLVEKPAQPESNMAMAGLYFFGPQLWDLLPNLQPSARGEYEITDAIQLLIDAGHLVLAKEHPGEWFDTGTLDSFLQTSRYLCGEDVRLAADAKVQGTVSGHLVVGEGAEVEATSLENVVVLPGARVRVQGSIRDAILGGEVEVSGDVRRQVIWGGESISY
ncbi:MAG TPA: sugar phosphate nucleotidyltransferase [Fimbriimonadaceae bacterium]|nr:sugar phosphate nucleotidyltransferase [Fimbriimonadaceae bacterium]HRJ33595.1 sugar phosphate nucleotidyltransferase [Fimbriimonadaceae bacterium]